MNDPRLNQIENTVESTGAAVACTNEYGVHDMVGNVHEWADDGAFHGGYYLDTEQNGEGCDYTTTAHAKGYYDYTLGGKAYGHAPSDYSADVERDALLRDIKAARGRFLAMLAPHAPHSPGTPPQRYAGSGRAGALRAVDALFIGHKLKMNREGRERESVVSFVALLRVLRGEIVLQWRFRKQASNDERRR